jgi:hypothetical protein
LLAGKEVSLEILRLPDLVHNLNDVGIFVETILCPLEDLVVADHPFVVEAFAAQALQNLAKATHVKSEPLT